MPFWRSCLCRLALNHSRGLRFLRWIAVTRRESRLIAIRGEFMLTDAELNAAISESGWVLRDKNALNEFRALARAIEKRCEARHLAILEEIRIDERGE